MTKPIAYEPHPVSVERKAELISQGLKIVDARFKPENEVATQDEAPAPQRGRPRKVEIE